jgi:glycosyltransferase involved in cell wall biosynthesis
MLSDCRFVLCMVDGFALRFTLMKICIDAREFVSGRQTGIGRYLEGLLTGLSDRPDIELTLFVNSLDSVPPSLCKPSVTLIALPRAPTLMVDQIILPRLAQNSKADVFFSPYYKVPLTGQFKRVITVHDIMFLRLPAPHGVGQAGLPGLSRLKRLLVAIQLRLAARRADMILVDSRFTGDDLAAFTASAVSKTRVLYPTLDSVWLTPVSASIAEQIRARFADRRPFFLYVGNFRPHKNVDLLVEAFLKLESEGKAQDRCLLLVGGDDENAPRIERQIAVSGRKLSIRIHRNISDADLRALYAAAEWFVTASKYEGFGYPVLEAMAGGCPVICHPCTSLPEITGDAALPITALNPSAIANVLERAISMSTSERESYVTKGKTKAAEFCSDNSSKAFLELLGCAR